MKRNATLLLFLFGFGLLQLQSQDYLELIQNPNETTTLQDIQTLANSYFETHGTGQGSGYKQYKRWEYRTERQVNADGKIKNFSRLSWDVISNLSSSNSQTGRSAGNWTAIGPTAYTNGNGGYNGGLGRVNVIAFHPTNANIIYIGLPAGGVWKTTDGGSTWTPMADMLTSIGISGIAVDHSSPNTVYILTGDGDGGDTQSIGIMKSTDGGASWGTTGLTWGVTSFNRGYKLLMDPTNSNTMFAVTTIGILKTTDGWATWTNVQGGSFRDIEFKPGDPTTIYATTTDTFYRSTNSGTSWSVVSTGLPTGENRAAIAVSAANSNYVYYLAGPNVGTGAFKGIFRSTNSGASFSTMATTPNILGYSNTGADNSSQSWYDLSIAVNPTDANNPISGSINIWRSTDGGVNNTCITNWFQPSGAFEYVHPDIHEMVYNPVDNKLYCGSDGGISVSTDHGVTWSNIWNGLQIMQFYRIAGAESNQNLLVGGSQDNGSNKYTGSPTIEHILGGDGMDCMVDYNNTNNLYYSFQNGGLQRSTNGGTTYTGIQPSGSTGAWVTPYAMDASNPSILYGGYNDVYRSTNMGTSWTNLGSDGRGALAIGVNDPARLYAANGSALQTSANTGGSWSTITGPWPALTITYITVDPSNASRVWITLGGYTSGQKVYESTNAGGSWTNISGGLPNIPALCIVYENTGGSPMDALYVGTDVGVYYGSDSTAWTLYNTGLPNVPVFDLEINHTNGLIRAGTFGRGLWETNLFGVVVCDILSTSANATPPSCPGGTDGTLTIGTTCTTCSGITYTITPTAPPGPSIVQVGNNVFTNIPANSYNVYVEDTGDPSCNDTWVNNPVVVPAGTDGNAPAIGCPPNITVECGNDTSPASTGTAVASDTCDPSPSVTFADSSVAGCGNTETITRTWTATDASGNASSCDQIITVVDTTDPAISCTANITVNNDTGVCEAVVNYPAPISSDTCGNVTVTQTAGFSSGSLFPVGTTTNVFISTDDCGNVNTCSFTVTVIDNEDPVLVCPPDQVVNPDTGSQFYTVPNYLLNGLASVTDNCTNPPAASVQTPAVGAQLAVGVYTVTITVDDAAGNSANCSFQLTVTPTLGIQELNLLNSLTLDPNPARDSIILSNPQLLSLQTINIYDITGKLINTINIEEMGAQRIIDISTLTSSTYLFVIKGSEGQITKQVIVK